MTRIILTLLVCAASAAAMPINCGTNPSQSQITLLANPGVLDFALAPGSQSQQSITLSEIGGASANDWTASANAGWLSLTSSAGTCATGGCGSIGVRANAAGLQGGVYTGSVSVTPRACGLTGASVSVTVRLTIARISISTTPASVSLVAGGGAQAVTVNVARENYSGHVTLGVSDTPSGLSTSVVSPGTGNSGTITLQASASAPSVSNRNVTITASGAGLADASTTFALSITQAPRAMSLTSTNVGLNASFGGSSVSQQVQLSFTGGAAAWTAAASSTGNWLSVSPASGTGDATLNISANPSGLQANTYNGTITVTAPGVSNTPQVIAVRLSVAAGGGLPEPALTIRLNPGFYIAEVETPPGEPGGYWGMEALVPRGLFSGGFNLGGGVQENGRSNTFGAFNVPSTQRVRVRAETVLIPGQDNSRFSIVVRLLRLLSDGTRQVVVPDQAGVSLVEFERTLDSGFYIIEVATAAAAPRGIVLLGINADAFAGGVNVGGFVAPGLVGFGAFYVPEAQDVRLSVLGRPSYGSSAAGSLKLTLRDHPARNVIRTVP